MKASARLLRLLGILILLALTFGSAGPAHAFGDSHFFPETGHTVSGLFWQYWQTHGGLMQHGYPISDEVLETSDLDGKTYRVQYFERAVFEMHPENAGTPYEVLLTQLGTLRYRAKYGPAGVPAQLQQVNSANALFFPQTGHTLGGAFRAFWEAHGGVAQLGYPISDEFREISELDGKTYTVQYTERAELEWHPENKPPFDVLLSQVGTERYNLYHPGGQGLQPAPPLPSPTATPVPPCDQDLPASENATVTPHCGPIGTIFVVHATGFTPDEPIVFWDMTADNQVVGTPSPLNMGPHGSEIDTVIDSRHLPAAHEGIWTTTYRGEVSGHRAVVSYKITSLGLNPPPGSPGGPTPTATATPTPAGPPPTPPGSTADCSGIPAGQNVTVLRPCAPAGTVFYFNAGGFKPNEMLTIDVKDPSGKVVDSSSEESADEQGEVLELTFGTEQTAATGVWTLTMVGSESHATAIGYFKVTPRGSIPLPTCDTSGTRNGQATPSAGRLGDVLEITVTGFQPGEQVSTWITLPTGEMAGSERPEDIPINPDGSIGPLPFQIDPGAAELPGRWSVTFQGAKSGNKATVYFCVGP
jgi:hypothetical protein